MNVKPWQTMRKIHFSDREMRFILEGSKTQVAIPKKPIRNKIFHPGTIAFAAEKHRLDEIGGTNVFTIQYKADGLISRSLFVPERNGYYFNRFVGRRIKGNDKIRPWTPPGHMPMELARVFIEITACREIDLFKITPEDAAAQGFRLNKGRGVNCHIDWLKDLWIEKHGEELWYDQPVTVYDFVLLNPKEAISMWRSRPYRKKHYAIQREQQMDSTGCY